MNTTAKQGPDGEWRVSDLLAQGKVMAEYLKCGCQVVYLAQGYKLYVCARHHSAVLSLVKET